MREDLAPLGALVEDEKGALSPIGFDSDEGGGELSPEQRARLEREKILTKAGHLTKKARFVFAALARPVARAEMRVSSTVALCEHAVYFPAGDTQTVSLSTQGERIAICQPAPAEELAETVRQVIGDSLLSSSNLCIQLNFAEACVFSAVVDLYRRESLKSFLDDAGTIANSFTCDRITASIKRAQAGDNRWLLGIMKSIGPSSAAEDVVEGVDGALEGLVGSGHLKKQDDGAIALAPPGVRLAENLLLIESTLLGSAARVGEDGEVLQADVLCLQAGVHDLLTIERADGSVRMECLAPGEVCAWVKQLLTNPELLVGGADDAPSHCPKCHAATAPESHFCSACGAPLTGSE